MAVMYSFP